MKYRNIELGLLSQLHNLPEYAPPKQNDQTASPLPLVNGASTAANTSISPLLQNPTYVNRTTKTMSVYVPTFAKAQIWLKYSIFEPHSHARIAAHQGQEVLYYFKLFLNGKLVTSWGCDEESDYEGKVNFLLFDPVQSRRRHGKGCAMEKRMLCFGPLEPDMACLPGERMLEVRVFRARARMLVERGKEKFHDTIFAKNGMGRFGDGFLGSGMEENGFEDNLSDDGTNVSSMYVDIGGETNLGSRVVNANTEVEQPLDSVDEGIRLIYEGKADDDHPRTYYKYILVDPVDDPYATFRYYYRTWNQLNDLSIHLTDDDDLPTPTATPIRSKDSSDKTDNENSRPVSYRSPTEDAFHPDKFVLFEPENGFSVREMNRQKGLDDTPTRSTTKRKKVVTSAGSPLRYETQKDETETEDLQLGRRSVNLPASNISIPSDDLQLPTRTSSLRENGSRTDTGDNSAILESDIFSPNSCPLHNSCRCAVSIPSDISPPEYKLRVPPPMPTSSPPSKVMDILKRHGPEPTPEEIEKEMSKIRNRRMKETENREKNAAKPLPELPPVPSTPTAKLDDDLPPLPKKEKKVESAADIIARIILKKGEDLKIRDQAHPKDVHASSKAEYTFLKSEYEYGPPPRQTQVEKKQPLSSSHHRRISTNSAGKKSLPQLTISLEEDSPIRVPMYQDRYKDIRARPPTPLMPENTSLTSPSRVQLGGFQEIVPQDPKVVGVPRGLRTKRSLLDFKYRVRELSSTSDVPSGTRQVSSVSTESGQSSRPASNSSVRPRFGFKLFSKKETKPDPIRARKQSAFKESFEVDKPMYTAFANASSASLEDTNNSESSGKGMRKLKGVLRKGRSAESLV